MTEIKSLFDNNPFFTLTVLMGLGISLAYLAKKVHLPKITGYITAGILVGEPVLGLVTKEITDGFAGISYIALGLMSFTIGAHIDFHKLKNSGKRVVSISSGEILTTFTLLFTVFYFFILDDLFLSLLIASISISTSPAAIVSVVKETKSKGLFVNTLMPVVAINNFTAIALFSLVLGSRSILTGSSLPVLSIVLSMIEELSLELIIGISCGLFIKYFAEKNTDSDKLILTSVLIAVFASTGLSRAFNLNNMLPNMIAGMTIINTSSYRKKILTVFEDLEYIIIIIFFTVAGTHLEIKNLAVIGWMALAYVLFRGIAKSAGGSLGAYLYGSPDRIYKNIGLSLIPQAGVAIGLLTLAANVDGITETHRFLTTLVLATVTLNELIGPLATRYALGKSGEVNKDRPQLIEFLSEEFINPNIKAHTKDQAIEEMVDFFIKSHKGSRKFKDDILKSVMERENDMSTGIGKGIAIPHGVVKSGPIIWGAMGISREGVEFDSLDGKPVHLIVLIVTPKKHKADMHLSVLSEISKMLSNDEIKDKLFRCRTADQVCEILTEQEHKNFNYFLD
ncbi:MAG: PTS sugar transporter subunit IIA [Spirochaetes bacterium]|nr:PTS sugar transporter subunit IIA [Spirochaetota bacterium]